MVVSLAFSLRNLVTLHFGKLNTIYMFGWLNCITPIRMNPFNLVLISTNTLVLYNLRKIIESYHVALNHTCSLVPSNQTHPKFQRSKSRLGKYYQSTKSNLHNLCCKSSRGPRRYRLVGHHLIISNRKLGNKNTQGTPVRHIFVKNIAQILKPLIYLCSKFSFPTILLRNQVQLVQ